VSEQPATAPVRTRHLWDYWRIIWEGRRILGTVVGVTLVVAILGTLALPKRYRAQTLVEFNLAQQVVVGGVTERSSARSVLDTEREFKTEFVKIDTRKMVEDAITQHDLTKAVPDLGRFKDPVGVLQHFVSADRLGQTNVAAITVSWSSPGEAALLANAVSETYVASDLNERVEAQKLRIEKYKETLGVKAGDRRAVIENELAIIKSGRPLDELLTLSTLKEKTSLATLWEQRGQAAKDLASASGVYGPASVEYREKSALVAQVDRQVKDALSAAVEELGRELKSLGGDPDAIAASQAPVTSLQQESNKEFEAELRKRVAEAEIIATFQESKARIIDPALPPRMPYTPKWPLNIMLALVVGFGFGGGLIFFKEYLDTTIKTLADVEQDLGLSLLCVVPLQDTDDQLDPIAKEALQTLRTGLLFASSARQDRVLLITASGPREGKTTLVRHLAEALAAAGEPVVVVDCDLRRGALSKLFKAARGQGLATFLAERKGRSLDEVLVKLSPNLALMPAGPLPPNPVDVISSPQFRQLLAELRERYRWVLVDSPPVGSVSDSILLANLADMVLMVLRHDTSDKEVVRRALTRLQGVGARIVGAALNGVDMSKAYNREYYYGRFYYGHYYGEESEAAGKDKPPSNPWTRLRKLLT
jgi:capsular exopolysaccharide synthesis family protein